MSAPAGDRRGGGIRSVASAAAAIAVITLVARIVGFGRWLAFSHGVGATCVGSTYQSVNAVPNALYEVAVGGVLAAVAVPLVSRALAEGRRDDAHRTSSALLTWTLAVLLPLALVVVLAAEPISRALVGASGCAGAVELGAELLRVFAVQIPLYGVGIVLAGVLHSHQRFVAAALAPLLSSLVVIATYLAYRAMVEDPAVPAALVPQDAVLVLGIGTTLGVVVLSVPLLVPVVRLGVRLRPTLRFPVGVSPRVRSLAAAGVLALAGQQLATLVVIWLANARGGPGTLNVHTYVQAVALLPYAVLAVPLATAAFPSLAREHAVEVAGARSMLGASWLAVLTAGLVSAGVLVAVARPVEGFFTQLDAGRGQASGAAALGAMDMTLAVMAPGVVALGAIGLLSRALYVEGRARLAGALVGAGWLLTTAIPLLLLQGSGAPERTLVLIGVGWSLGLGAAAVGLVVLTGRAWGRESLRFPGRPLLAAVLGASVAASVGWWAAGRWAISSVAEAAAACVTIGLLAAVLFGVVAAAVDPSVVRRLRRARRGARSQGTVS